MKIALISPPNFFDKGQSLPSLSLATISGILKNNDIEHICIDGNLISSFLNYKQNNGDDNFVLQEISDTTESFNPDYVFLSIWGVSIPFAFTISRLLKQNNPEIKILAGGIRDINTAEYILDKSIHIDYVFIGEAEISLPKLLHKLLQDKEIQTCQGVYSHSNRKILSNAPIEKQLSITPNYKQFTNINTEALFFESSRGCVYKCIFCGLHSTAYRRLTPDQTINRIAELVKNYNVKYINFADNFFPMKGQWISRFLELLSAKKLKIHWSCLIRADNIDINIIKKLKSAGCVGVFMGVESINMDTLIYINKSNSPEKYIQQLNENIKAFSLNGINIKVSTIIGFPNETKNNMWKTGKFVKSLMNKGVDAYTGPLVVYPDSELWVKYKQGSIKLNQIQNKNIRRNYPAMFHEIYASDPIISPNDFIPENKHMAQDELEYNIFKVLEYVNQM